MKLNAPGNDSLVSYRDDHCPRWYKSCDWIVATVADSRLYIHAGKKHSRSHCVGSVGSCTCQTDRVRGFYCHRYRWMLMMMIVEQTIVAKLNLQCSSSHREHYSNNTTMHTLLDGYRYRVLVEMSTFRPITEDAIVTFDSI